MSNSKSKSLPLRYNDNVFEDVIFLVSCVSQKSATRRRAANLYQSDWFRKARAYVEISGHRWFILSAEHGLLRPGAIIDPYDTTLSAMGAKRRKDWGVRVACQLDKTIGRAYSGKIVVLAGKHYRSPLAGYLGDRAIVPMAGLGIGSQKQWLATRFAEAREALAQAAQLDLFGARQQTPISLS